jgi:phenylalanyl-tRNA synthetase alpha chain
MVENLRDSFMNKDILQISKAFEADIKDISASALVDLRTKYLGRKSVLMALLKTIKDVPVEERKQFGADANSLRISIEETIAKIENNFSAQAVSSPIDVTAPGRKYPVGHIHPVTQTLEKLTDIFVSMGYEIASGPEVDDDWHNFEALNMGPEHPARDMQDTFYLLEGYLPRTHTSTVQIRYMEDHKPPIKIIAPGKVHRNENEDATHSWIFHQFEGLVIDEGITFADLKGTLEHVAREIFGPQTRTRFRPNFFPYTEPSGEMDASCPLCDGTGCRSCGGTGWLELLGSGMVHPQVLRNMGIDPDKYSGFAFGMGVDRIAMIKHQIPDARLLWHPDVRFLEQF